MKSLANNKKTKKYIKNKRKTKKNVRFNLTSNTYSYFSNNKIPKKNNKKHKQTVENELKEIEENEKNKSSDGFVKVQCGPKAKEENDFTCYSNESLIKLKDMWNKRHPDVQISSNDPKIIWETLKKNLKSVCNKESCWLKQTFSREGLDQELLNYTFAPKSPDDWKKNPNEWLSSIDIENVMKQYENEYPYFDFIGPSPIDFNSPKMYGECVWEELCHFNLKKYLENGKNKIGIIFNTDPHYLPGSHWISMFINIKQKYIFFFDSTGDKAPKEIEDFVKNIMEQGLAENIKFRYIENRKQHQKKNTECGVYSLFMIIHILTEKLKPEDFTNEELFTDSEMAKFRKIYFNTEI